MEKEMVNSAAGKMLKSALMKVSGWGSGLAILFVFFNRELDFSPEKVKLVDTVMSIFVMTFVVVLTKAITTFGVSIERAANQNFIHKLNRAFRGVLVLLTFVAGGIFFIEFVGDAYGETRTAFVLGLVLISMGITMGYFGFLNLMGRE